MTAEPLDGTATEAIARAVMSAEQWERLRTGTDVDFALGDVLKFFVDLRKLARV